MPVPNGNIEPNHYKKQRRWSLVGILSKKKKFKKSLESVDFCPYDGKINKNVALNNHLERSTDCLIEQYTCSPRLIRRCNSLQYTNQLPTYSNITSKPKSNEWKSSQQSVHSSSSSACYSDVGMYRSYENSNQSSSYYIKEENEKTYPVLQNVPFRCSSEIGNYQNKTNYNKGYNKSSSVGPNKLIGKKIPPPPPPRDPNVKAVYYFRNNRLMSRESDSTYFSQDSDDNFSDDYDIFENNIECRNELCIEEPPRSRRPIQICDVETLSSESKNSTPKIQTAEEALQELEDIYNSLGLSDEDLLDRAERRDLPTQHQNMRYESFDELDSITFNRILPKTRRSGVPNIISDDMAYRRLNKKESKRQTFIPGSFLLALPTIYNVDKSPKVSGEPDITLDDVVFRSRRQHLNFLKISDPQPPFGIPLGPIVGAAPSDYLHAVPEGRYKPLFHPRKIPDTVEDDLAFRNLRKENKYKTCIDFSFIRKNKYEIDSVVPINNNRIKNDTHWIIKKTSVNSSNNKNQVKFTIRDFADSVADGEQNLMVVKINHHKPIMLSGFTLSEANLLSKSIFCTKLLQHEPRRQLRLTKDTRNPNYSPQLKFGGPLNALNGPKANRLLPAASKRSADVRKNDVHERGKQSLDARVLQFTEFDTDGLSCLGVDYYSCKNQPNFRELIKREYAHNTPHRYPLKENQSNFVQSDRETSSFDTDNSRAEIKHRFTNNGCASKLDSTASGTAASKSKIEDPLLSVRTSATPRSSAENAGDNGTGSPSTTGPKRNSSSSLLSSPASSSQSSVPIGGGVPNCMPGYLEVCLYITVSIYQLFSANAYSTLVALIFLVALHVCRRLS